jgi:hypothetical protein
VHPAQICIKCTRHKFATSALGTNLQQIHHAQINIGCIFLMRCVFAEGECYQQMGASAQIYIKYILHRFVSSASRTNLYQMHSAQICNKYTRHKFATSAFAQICNKCITHKFLSSALGTNLQQVPSQNLSQVHLAQIFIKCISHKFLSSALDKNLKQVHSAQICNTCTWHKFKNKCIPHQTFNRCIRNRFSTNAPGTNL